MTRTEQMTREQHLAAIRATCVRLRETAKASSEKPWIDNENGGIQSEKLIIADHVRPKDAAFIAACAGNAERGWETTIVAIDHAEDLPQCPRKDWMTNNIIAQWPVESLIIKGNEPCEGRR